MGGMLAARTKKRCTPDRLSLPQMYMRQRWYDSSLGRFISRDPIGLKGGTNLYAYASDSPAQITDPMGLKPQPYPGNPPDDVLRKIKRRYKQCYKEILKKWGDYVPKSGAEEDITYWYHNGKGGCADWVLELRGCLAKYEWEFEGYGILNLDLWVNAPWAQHHAIAVAPLNNVKPETITVLDPWISGKPEIYGFDLWMLESKAYDYVNYPEASSPDRRYAPSNSPNSVWKAALDDVIHRGYAK